MVNISVIVPFYNAEKYINECIQSLISQKYPHDDYEIIFVDNNSTDSSADIVKSHPGVKLLSEKKQGSYAARNTGIKESRGQIIAFTDPDCIASPDWLSKIEKAMSDPGIQIVIGGNQMADDSSFLSLLEDYENEMMGYIFNTRDADKYFGRTNNMAVRRKMFDEEGLFVEIKRGADSIFVNTIAKKYSADAVSYNESVKVRHMEIKNPLDYYNKTFIYGRSSELMKHYRKFEPVSPRQNLSVYKALIKKKSYPHLKSVILIFLLIPVKILRTLGEFSARYRKVKE